jgi:hypothetical protein
MIADPRKFYIGVGLLAFFAVVLVIFFLPVLDGKNPMTYLDSLYNSISKQDGPAARHRDPARAGDGRRSCGR